MMKLARMRTALVVTVLLALFALARADTVHAQPASPPRGEIRIVDKSPNNWVWITLNVMEHLIETDPAGKLVPRLATGWRWLDELTLEVKLRPGVKFHNGEVFTYNRKTQHGFLDEPADRQGWDIALRTHYDLLNFPIFHLYVALALDGQFAWTRETAELRRLYDDVLRTVDREKQQAVIRQMERHTREQAYFLFLYNPVGLYAANKAVKFVPYVSTSLILAETAVTDQHWSLRKAGARR